LCIKSRTQLSFSIASATFLFSLLLCLYKAGNVAAREVPFSQDMFDINQVHTNN
jgi:hypothetical protein